MSKDTLTEKDTSELDIYNQIFNTESQDIISDLRQEITTLNDRELKNVLDYIKVLKEEDK